MDISKLETEFFSQEIDSKYRLLKLTVISPVFEKGFLEQYAKTNSDILLVTDFRSKLDVDRVSKSLPNIKCVLSKANQSNSFYSIVHAKLFFFEWEHLQTGQTHFILLWGSSNATLAGFNRNAEVYSWCNVSENIKIIEYFSNIRTASFQKKFPVKLPEMRIQLKSVFISFQALILVENVDDFESWLENGFLWHPLEYADFGTLRIELNKELTNPKVASPIEKKGFKVTKGRNITYHYVNNDIKKEFSPEIIDNFEYLRRTKMFSTETIYGFWTSNLFYHDWHKTIDSEREFVLNRIANSTKDQHRIWINSILDLLQLAIDEMTNKEDIIAHFYVSEIETGRYIVNRDMYLDGKSKLMTQISEDKLLCEKEYFRTAYLRGGIFAEVPYIRFSPSWEDFLNSWCKNVLKEVERKNSKNRLAIILKKSRKIWKDEQDLLSWLRNFGEWRTIQNSLSEYHRGEQRDMFEIR